MNRALLFRVLYYLQDESDPLMLAQDAYVVMRLCRVQLKELPQTLADWKTRTADDAVGYLSAVSDIDAMLPLAPMFLDIIDDLQERASQFWLCAPVDLTRNGKGQAAQRWQQHVGAGAPLPPETTAQLLSFKARLGEVLREHCADLLLKIEDEELAERARVASLPPRRADLLNAIPLSWQHTLRGTTQVFVACCKNPMTHFHFADPGLAKLLGFAVARMICTPVAQVVIDDSILNDVVGDMNCGQVKTEKLVILSYRTSRQALRTIQWQLCAEKLNDCYFGVGVDITDELYSFKESSSANTQKMLRQWLHSIRNASFEQQAAILLDELKDLRSALGRRPDLEARFAALTEGLVMLKRTAERSVGLIDHALDTKGFVQLLPVQDFLQSLAIFPSSLDGRLALPRAVRRPPLQLTCVLNDRLVSADDLSGLFVKCDILNMQSLVDKLMYSCASCTDPHKGVEIFVAIDSVGAAALVFRIYIVDFCRGGLAPAIFERWRERLGHMKCVDTRGREPAVTARVPPRLSAHRRGDAEGPGDDALPATEEQPQDQEVVEYLFKWIFDARNRFMHSQQDGDFTVMTFNTGTTYKLRFTGAVNTPSSRLLSTPDPEDDMNDLEGQILVVDDSAVIRKILRKYLDGIKVPYHCCEDGLQALEWFQLHHDSCAGVITDLEMPKLGGDALIARVTALKPGFPCFVLSGNAIDAVNLPVGARRAIVKPVVLADVQGVLQEILSLQLNH